MTQAHEKTTIKIGDREKDFNPLPRNMPLHYLIKEFNETGKALFVIEPGDLTRYIFFLVQHPRVPTFEDDAWYILPMSGLSGEVRTYSLGFSPQYAAPHDFNWLSNTHSQLFIAAWIEWFYGIWKENSS